jgi:hypothetical protein
MKAPPGAKDVASFKMLVKQKNTRMEELLNEHVSQIKNTGFADQRLAQMAYSKFEEGWLLLDKALRIDADPREYGKVAPLDTPIPSDFAAPLGIEDKFNDDGG